MRSNENLLVEIENAMEMVETFNLKEEGGEKISLTEYAKWEQKLFELEAKADEQNVDQDVVRHFEEMGCKKAYEKMFNENII